MKNYKLLKSKKERNKFNKFKFMSSLNITIIGDVILILVICSLPPYIIGNKINKTNFISDNVQSNDFVVINRTVVSDHNNFQFYTNSSLYDRNIQNKINTLNSNQASLFYGQMHTLPKNNDNSDYDDDASDDGSVVDDSSEEISSSDVNSNYQHNLFYTTRITNCNACRMREEHKSNSLLSIRAHVLQKLGFDHPPNITNDRPPPPVPESIIKDFYNSSGYPYYGNDKHDPDRMMSDQPAVYSSTFQPGHEFFEEDDDYFSVMEKMYAFPKSKFLYFLKYIALYII